MSSKTSFVATALSVAFLLSAGAALAERVYKGEITLQDGTVIDALKIRGMGDVTEDEDSITLKLQDGSNVQVARDQIASYEFIEFKDKARADNVIVTLSNGNTARLRYLYISDTADIYTRDTFTGEPQWVTIDLVNKDRSIARVAFEAVGEMMWSEGSQEYFPTSYSYDPFTGEELTPRTPK